MGGNCKVVNMLVNMVWAPRQVRGLVKVSYIYSTQSPHLMRGPYTGESI